MLRSELHKAHLEILSYVKVINVLQEDLYKLRTHPDCVKQSDFYNEQLQYQKSTNDWIHVASHSQVKSKVCNNNLIQVIPCMANKFEILSNLNDNEKSYAAFEKEESSNVRSGYQKVTKNPPGKSRKSVSISKQIPSIVNKKLPAVNLSNNPRSPQRLDLINKESDGIPSARFRQRGMVLMLGDSHTRGLAKEVQHNIGKDFEVQALVKPGANIEAILNPSCSAVANLTKKDVCIIWEGTRDVAKNESNRGLRLLRNFISSHQNTNFILLCVPHRHDLEMNSCVNSETIAFNRKLKKLNKLFDNLRVIDVSTVREVFTRHGLHMNQIGKEQTAVKIATEVKTLFHGNKCNPIVLQWAEEEILERVEEEDVVVIGALNSEEKQETAGMPTSWKNDPLPYHEETKLRLRDNDSNGPITREVRSSTRQKRYPATRSEDFLWSRD